MTWGRAKRVQRQPDRFKGGAKQVEQQLELDGGAKRVEWEPDEMRWGAKVR